MKVNQNTDLRPEINSLDLSAIFSFLLVFGAMARGRRAALAVVVIQ